MRSFLHTDALIHPVAGARASVRWLMKRLRRRTDTDGCVATEELDTRRWWNDCGAVEKGLARRLCWQRRGAYAPAI